jgi:hypothetical protein
MHPRYSRDCPVTDGCVMPNGWFHVLLEIVENFAGRDLKGLAAPRRAQGTIRLAEAGSTPNCLGLP